MKLITFHRRQVEVSYKNSICSLASVFCAATSTATVLLPLFLVLQLSSRQWLESVLVWEQPHLQFSYEYNVWAPQARDEVLVGCSSLRQQRSLLEEAQTRNGTRGCPLLKVSETDWNHDGVLDEMFFQVTTPGPVDRISVQLFFASSIQRFCHFHDIPTVLFFDSGQPLAHNLFLFDLQLAQQVAFKCPLVFRHQETLFRPLNLSALSHEQLSPLNIHRRVQRNPGHFHFTHVQSFYDPSLPGNSFRLLLRVPQLMIRFETPIWHQIFATWMKFLSLYIVFYLLARWLKDYAFGRYWIRSWEVIPWKKIY